MTIFLKLDIIEIEREEGKMERKIWYCPTCEIDCPYCVGLDYECIIDNPLEDCDCFFGLEEEDE